MIKVKIADVVIKMDFPEKAIHEDFYCFLCDKEEKEDFIWAVSEKGFPVDFQNVVWKDMPNFKLGQGPDEIIMRVLNHDIIEGVIFKDDYARAVFYLKASYCDLDGIEDSTQIRNTLKNFQREAFFLAMLYRGGISIHSASIVYQNMGIVFSATSGVGKTTHSNMWEEYYSTPILDGDITICRVLNDKAYVYGLPWCGSSGKFMNCKVELAGIVFLEQGLSNVVTILSRFDSAQWIFAKSFSPMWFREFIDLRLEIINNILSSTIWCCKYTCEKNKSAVDVIKSFIDYKIDKN
jgi:hypothetical protein